MPVVAAPEKRRYQMVLHEVKPGWTITKEWEGYTIEADIAFKRHQAGGVPRHLLQRRPRAGIHPRRRGPAPHHALLLRRRTSRSPASATASRSRPAPAASAAGAWRRSPKCKFDLEVCGGIYVNEPCVVDGNLVSGRTFHDHGHYMGPWIKMLLAAPRGT